jgi:alginate production protein
VLGRAGPWWWRPAVARSLAGAIALALLLAPRVAVPQVDEFRARERAFNLDAPPETRIRLTPALGFGAELELKYESIRNRDLDDSQDDRVSVLEPLVSLALSYDPARWFSAYVNVEVAREFLLDEPAGSTQDRKLEVDLKEAFLWFKDIWLDAWSVQIGRQLFEDDRKWLYDAELDAVRLQYVRDRVGLELSVSREALAREDVLRDTAEDRINNYVVYGRYEVADEVEVAGYVILRDNRDVDGQRPLFFGIRSFGEIVTDVDYWFELSQVWGEDGDKRLRGWALDVGATGEFPLPFSPSLTLGYAFGSGDTDPDDRTDRRFRQTGLHENETEFAGVVEFKYYGELLDPELSNLSILTIGAGVQPTERSSVDLVFHYYLQHHRSTPLGDTRLAIEPTGRSRALGTEIDLILGLEQLFERIDAKLAVGYFMPGRAFPAGADDALFVSLEIQFAF